MKNENLAAQAMSGVGTLGRVVGGFLGAVTTAVLMLTIGIYLAVDPRPYERGLSWMIAERHRAHVADTLDHMAYNLRRLLAGRLLGMMVEGVSTWILLAIYGVPMAALLGLLTGLLAFLLQADWRGLPLADCYLGVDDQPAPLHEVVDWLRAQLQVRRQAGFDLGQDGDQFRFRILQQRRQDMVVLHLRLLPLLFSCATWAWTRSAPSPVSSCRTARHR